MGEGFRKKEKEKRHREERQCGDCGVGLEVKKGIPGININVKKYK